MPEMSYTPLPSEATAYTRSRRPSRQHDDGCGNAVEWKSVLDVDIVRSIDAACQQLPQVTVDAKHREPAIGRGDFYRAEDQALRRIETIDPDRWIVRIVRDRVGR